MTDQGGDNCNFFLNLVSGTCADNFNLGELKINQYHSNYPLNYLFKFMPHFSQTGIVNVIHNTPEDSTIQETPRYSSSDSSNMDNMGIFFIGVCSVIFLGIFAYL